jgi:hypothetical protein
MLSFWQVVGIVSTTGGAFLCADVLMAIARRKVHGLRALGRILQGVGAVVWGGALMLDRGAPHPDVTFAALVIATIGTLAVARSRADET